EGASPFPFPASLLSGDTKPTRNIVLEKSYIHKIYLDNLFLAFLEKMEWTTFYCKSFIIRQKVSEKRKVQNPAMKIKSVYDIIET
ncbi:hypothetical protein, partial [Aedoeadaptatus nemausensis]|uniref:hypothetical protein n=1 Tax=Aedoeadaptatus nemausensis TaxID=2582829 RepID=UPI001C550F51